MKLTSIPAWLLLLLSACSAATAPALKSQSSNNGFTGTWKMTQITDQSTGSLVNCSPSTLSITQTDTALTFDTTSISCGALPNHYVVTQAAWAFIVQNGQLSYQGYAAGAIGSTYIHVALPLFGGTTYNINIDLKGNTYSYGDVTSGKLGIQALIAR